MVTADHDYHDVDCGNMCALPIDECAKIKKRKKGKNLRSSNVVS